MNEYCNFGDWELLKELGSGGFGTVLHWRNRQTRQEIATKSLKENHNLNDDEIAKIRQRWKKEYDCLYNMQTEFIVGGIRPADIDFVHYLNEYHIWHPLPVIIMKYCNGGDVRKVLEKPENINGLSEFEVREILRCLCAAVKYMHTKFGIEHRDLKPDNIVIHQDPATNKKLYKITDLGFARKTATSKNTVVKSVVGTKHYFAPEILETEKYTNSVDYWSIAVIGYELITGSLPFIPHKPLPTIIKNIRIKGSDCIAITENVNKSSEFIFEKELPTQQFLSNVFKISMQNWLRLGLDINPKTRGFDMQQQKFTFYENIDEIIDYKILTIFYLNDCKFLSYRITHANSKENWWKIRDYISEDTGTVPDNLIVILPGGHSISALTCETRIGDLFMKDWQDTAGDDTPPVMLYVVECKRPFNLSQEHVTTDTILKCINNEVIVDEWILLDYERQTHFMLSKAQHILKAFANGAMEWILTIEDMCHKHKTSLDAFLLDIAYMKGRIDQFNVSMLHMMNKKSYNHTITDKLQVKYAQYNNDLKTIQQMSAPLKKQFDDVCSKAKKLSEQKFCDNLIKSDIYQVKSFQRAMTPPNHAPRCSTLDICTKAIYDCSDNYQNCFTNNAELNMCVTSAMDLCEEFAQILHIEKICGENIRILDTNLSNRELVSDMENFNTVVNQLQSLNIDGASLSNINSLDDICNIQTPQLIRNVLQDLVKMENEIDEDMSLTTNNSYQQT